MGIQRIENPVARKIAEYGMIALAIEIMVIGTYFFKFPNHFAFGGVAGFAAVFSAICGISSTAIANIGNYSLLVLGFIFLGKEVGIKTVFATVVMSGSLSFLNTYVPMDAPFTQEPLLELIFAIVCPAIASAILFNISASSGGTDIIAMILRKYTSINIGTALLLVDIFSVGMAFFVFGPATGLYSVLGLVGKSIGIDSFMESMNRCKCFTVITDHPEPICEFIIQRLNRSATTYEAQGAYTHTPKTVIISTMNPRQAIQLRNFIHATDPKTFFMISNSSEIIGKGFLPG